MKKILLFVISAFIMSTIANAQVWIEQNSNFGANEGILDISAVNDNTAWIVGYDGSGGGANLLDYAVSSDGGSNFVTGTVGTDTTFRVANISAISADTAWVAMFNNVLNAGGGIWQTTDGGASWLQQAVGLIYDANSFPDIVHFWNANEGVTIGDPNNGYFEIYTTIDGGATWTRVPQANIPANVAQEAGITNWYDSYGDNVWFYTSKGRIYHSADKGLNWTVSSIVSLTAAQSMTVKFLDANYGIAQIAVAASGAFASAKKTTDGGATWTAYTP
ncbi:MAG: YCF48-related protein, partial [Bacteroidota bacterium]